MATSDEPRRGANIVAALALVVADRVGHVTHSATGRPSSDTTALVVLATSLQGASQDRLGAVLGITQSGTARLVRRLLRDGLVERSQGPDARTNALTVTPQGEAMASAAQHERLSAVAAIADVLSIVDREQLTVLAEKLLGSLASSPADAFSICRMCDPQACGHYDGRCPVTNAVDRKTGRRDSQP